MAQLTCNFVSYSLKRGVDICITLPSLSSCDVGAEKKPCHTPMYKYPVLYLLHGYGNDYKSWYRYTSVERYAEEKRIAIVTLNADNKCYMNTVLGDNYYDFVAYELPEFVCGNFPISSDPKDTYIAGLSMGGYGALVHALSRTSAYRAAGAFSPGIDIGRKEDLIGADLDCINLYTELETCVKNNCKLPELFLCCGQNDFLYDSVVNFHGELTKKAIPHRWDDVPGFEHEWKFWDIELEEFLDWLPRTDPYAGMPAHKI